MHCIQPDPCVSFDLNQLVFDLNQLVLPVFDLNQACFRPEPAGFRPELLVFDLNQSAFRPEPAGFRPEPLVFDLNPSSFDLTHPATGEGQIHTLVSQVRNACQADFAFATFEPYIVLLQSV